MVRRTQSRIQEFLIFAGTYLGSRVVSSLAFGAWIRSLGASRAGVELVLSENEMILQVFSLLIAFYVLSRRHGVNSPWAFLKGLFPPSRMGAETTSSWIVAGALRGFLAASTLVSLSLFLGFSTVEWPVWSWSWVASLLPLILMESFGLLLWILLLDKTLLFLRSSLHFQSRPRRLETDLLIVALGAHLLFRVLNGSPHLFDRVFTGLFCALLSSCYLLWIDSSPFLHGGEERGRWIRLSIVSGFLLSWVHLYGQILGGTRSLSVLAVFEGPVLEPMGSLAHAGLVGECLVLLGAVVAVNLLLQRVLRRESDPR